MSGLRLGTPGTKIVPARMLEGQRAMVSSAEIVPVPEPGHLAVSFHAFFPEHFVFLFFREMVIALAFQFFMEGATRILAAMP